MEKSVNVVFIASAEDVMFSSALVSLFVCVIDKTVFKNYSTDFHKNRLKGGTWAKEEISRFWWQSGSRYVRVWVW